MKQTKRRPGTDAHVVAIEVKRAERWDRASEKPMQALASAAGIKVDRMIGVYCGPRAYRFGGVQVWPVGDFVKALYGGRVLTLLGDHFSNLFCFTLL